MKKRSIQFKKRRKEGKRETREVEGIFLANAKGFGFVRVSEEEDIFVSRDDTRGAMNGDRVLVRLKRARKDMGNRAEGEVVKVLFRANFKLVGYHRKVNQYGIVIPDDKHLSEDIYIPAGQSMGALTGDKVLVEITCFPRTSRMRPEGKVTEILGHVTDPGTDILSIVRSFELPEAFPEEVQKEAESVSAYLPDERKRERKDFTALYTLTIDGEDAKDLDDAVSLEKLENGMVRLGVHIADVGEYVKEGSYLDREAFLRGSSVYLPDRVLPMLPPVLSNGVCSLNPGEKRFSLSCLMEIDAEGAVISHEICESVIRSDRRMRYDEVHAILQKKVQAAGEEEEKLFSLLRAMDATARRLRKKREARGCIDFDFPESKVVLDSSGRAVRIHAYERNAATRMIEDFMIAANETVAEEYRLNRMPFLYRVHDKPDPEKIRQLSLLIETFGFTLRTRNGDIHPEELQTLLHKIRGTESENFLSRVVLRAMKQARYDETLGEHFGLASDHYTHFTSPIRRYPDLQIHRIIKRVLHGEADDRWVEHLKDRLPYVASESSRLERRAEEAERASVHYKKCEYMEAHIGERYDGIISGVTRSGFYVELPNTVEGMVRLKDLKDDFYQYDEEHFLLRGEMKHKTYIMGQKIRIRVQDADRLSGTVDFIPDEKTGGEA